MFLFFTANTLLGVLQEFALFQEMDRELLEAYGGKVCSAYLGFVCCP